MLITNPDAPINLIENTSLRSFTQIAMTWQEGALANGSPVVDYTVSMAIGADSTDFNVLAENIITRSYIATGLSVGTFYQFKI